MGYDVSMTQHTTTQVERERVLLEIESGRKVTAAQARRAIERRSRREAKALEQARDRMHRSHRSMIRDSQQFGDPLTVTCPACLADAGLA